MGSISRSAISESPAGIPSIIPVSDLPCDSPAVKNLSCGMNQMVFNHCKFFCRERRSLRQHSRKPKHLRERRLLDKHAESVHGLCAAERCFLQEFRLQRIINKIDRKIGFMPSEAPQKISRTIDLSNRSAVDNASLPRFARRMKKILDGHNMHRRTRSLSDTKLCELLGASNITACNRERKRHPLCT